MTDSFAYSYLLDDDAPEATANAPFRRMVHAFSGKAPKPNLDRPVEAELIHLVQENDDPDAMEALIEHHTGFIANIASEFAGYNGMEASMEDLFSEGVQAFVGAVRRYKLNRDGARLNSFARYHVSGAILTYVLKNRYAFPVGTSSGERVFLLGYSKLVSKFSEIHGTAFQSTNPDHIVMMSEMTGTSPAAVRRVCALKGSGDALSTHAIQIVESRTPYLPEETTINRQRAAILTQEVKALLEKLKPRNRDIVSILMADDGDLGNKRADLADKHSLTAERVGQIYREALHDIRAALKARGINSCT